MPELGSRRTTAAPSSPTSASTSAPVCPRRAPAPRSRFSVLVAGIMPELGQVDSGGAEFAQRFYRRR
ncbi:hypothetical protein [Sorangium sp. So ce362]|uniref:hypothetical protein n=1 Tax=Sorangium sp. So ce362 TaxID=3133303 RepID=UPI003F644ADD